MFTLRVTQTRHAGRDRCRVCVYATGGFAFTRLFHILERMFLFHRKNRGSGPTGRIVSFAQFASVLDVFPSCEGTAASTTTSIQVMSSSIISPSSRASNVHSHLPLSASLGRALGTARSRGLGSVLAKAHVDTAEPCGQGATIARRSGSPRISGSSLSSYLACGTPSFILDRTKTFSLCPTK